MIAAIAPRLVVLAVTAALAAGGAWRYQANKYERLLAEQRTEHATAQAELTERNARRLVRVWERGDSLAAQLATQHTHISQLNQEHTHAIKRLTTGRACLSADLVGVLNRTQPATTARPDPVPTPPSGAAATNAASFATDADVGNWTASARHQYAECAARLGALIEWHGPMQQKNAPGER